MRSSERAVPENGRVYAIARARDLEPLLTLRQVAQLLQVSEKTVRRLVVHRRLPCVRVGRAVRFSRGDVAEWLAARTED